MTGFGTGSISDRRRSGYRWRNSTDRSLPASSGSATVAPAGTAGGGESGFGSTGRNIRGSSKTRHFRQTVLREEGMGLSYSFLASGLGNLAKRIVCASSAFGIADKDAALDERGNIALRRVLGTFRELRIFG